MRAISRDATVRTMLDVEAGEFLSVPDLLKATPVEEGGERFVYVEPSNETRDFQGEKVMAKALAASAEHFRRWGNLDLDHVSIVGARRGIANPYLYEIGRPVEVVADGNRTFVKGAIYQGDAPVAAHANTFWDSLTKLSPPKRWFPSVGGQVLAKSVEFDPDSQESTPVITSVRWSNIGFSATPVNPTVPGVSTVPFGLLAKSLTASGGIMLKNLTATPGGPDVATLTGGAALRKQSLDGKVQNYWDFRETLADDLLHKRCGGSAAEIVSHANTAYGLARAQGAEWCERFLSDLRSGLSKRKVH